MLSVAKTSKIVIGFLVLTLGLGMQSSYADWGRHHGKRGDFYHYHDHPHYGLSLSFVPSGSLSIHLGRSQYYYYDGIYYSNRGREYMIINPPVGAIVRTIPTDFRPVMINGITYYTDDGIYYVYTPSGYQVVPTPVTYVQSAPVQSAPIVVNQPTTSSVEVTAAANTFHGDDLYMINIPNDKNGYTSVTIKRSGTGFAGPQGEYYVDFPTVAQLKAIYAK